MSEQPKDGTVRLPIEPLRALCRRLFEVAGAPAEHAGIVADHLIEAGAMGLPSHGVIRVTQYLAEIAAGELDPSAVPEVTAQHGALIRVDGNRCFGQVGGQTMADTAGRLARDHGLSIVVGRRLGHTGRVGAYPERLARYGLVGIAVCTGPPSGHWVAPFGGRDGRLATNPISFAFPVAGAEPVVSDFSTAATAEGVIRSLRNRSLEAPDGFLRDADGRPTRDPSALYGTPRGAIQPLGGSLGYRGTGLAILVEVLATLLADDATTDATRVGTNMTIMALDPQEGFATLAADLAAHLRATRPIDPERPVMLPGDRERDSLRHASEMLVDRPTWAGLQQAANAAGLSLQGLDGAATDG